MRKATISNKKFLEIFPERELTIGKRVTSKFVFFEDDGDYWIKEQPTITAKIAVAFLLIPVGLAIAVWAGIREMPGYVTDTVSYLKGDMARVDLCPKGDLKTIKLKRAAGIKM